MKIIFKKNQNFLVILFFFGVDPRLRVFWCLRVESNRRHRDFQSLALPTELQRHILDAKE